MPKIFTAEQYAASAAFGDLRTRKSFGGDTQAWNTYQDTVYSKLRPGEALHASRPDLWKAAARQLQKIEAERKKPVKKLKVSTRWQNKHCPGVSHVQLGSPRPSACGMHVICQLSANMPKYGTCVEDIHYELPPAEGESDEEANMRSERHRHREQVALQWMYSFGARPYEKPRGHHGYSLYSSKGRRKTK